MTSDDDFDLSTSIDILQIPQTEEGMRTHDFKNKSVAFSDECTERDEHGHCRNRRRSAAPKFISDAMRMMSRRRSSVDPVHHGEVLSISKVKRTGSTLSLIGPLLVVLSALLIPAYCVPLLVDGADQPSDIIMPIATSSIVILPALIFLKWCGHIMKNSFDFGVSEGEDDKVRGRTGMLGHYLPSVPLISLSLAIVFRQANCLVKLEWEGASGSYSEFYMLLLDHGAGCSHEYVYSSNIKFGCSSRFSCKIFKESGLNRIKQSIS
jgi:hypothetical protein